MVLNAGSLNRRIQIRREVTTPDGHGGFNHIWSDLGAPIFARRRDVSDAERRVAGGGWDNRLVTRFVVRAFVAVGCPVSDAVALAEIIVDQRRSHRKVKKWLIAPAQSFERAIEVDDPRPADFDELKALSPCRSIVMIGTADIVAKVEDLFCAHAAKSEGKDG